MVGEPIGTDSGFWTTRARYALAKESASMEDLAEQQESDRTSLGIFRPKEISNLLIKPDAGEWKASFKAALLQSRLWDERTTTKQPPRKVPWKFQYQFHCDDSRCKGHQMMIEDWEIGALYWRTVDKGATPREAAKTVKTKFFEKLCSPDRDLHFFVGTVLEFGTWVIVGAFWPKKRNQGLLFETL